MIEYLVGIIVMQLITGCNTTQENNMQRTSHKCILFYSDNCGHCRRYKPIFNEIMIKHSNKLEFMMIEGRDFSNYPEYNNHINTINGVPAVFILSANNNLINKFIGARSFEETEQFIMNSIY